LRDSIDQVEVIAKKHAALWTEPQLDGLPHEMPIANHPRTDRSGIPERSRVSRATASAESVMHHLPLNSRSRLSTNRIIYNQIDRGKRRGRKTGIFSDAGLELNISVTN
jgi:hypothetical protein